MDDVLTSREYQEGYVKVDMKHYKLTGEVVYIGEVLTADEVLGITGQAPKGGFEIIRMPFMARMLEAVCGERGKLLAYLLENKDDSNRLDKTTDMVAKEAGVGKSTVRRVIDIMEKYGLLVQTKGVIYINPSLSHKGNNKREGYLFKSFDSVARAYQKGEYAEKGEDREEG